MRSQILVLVVMSLGVLAPACPPNPQPPQPPDAEDAGADEDGRRPYTPATACSNLAAVGCAEGHATDCVVTVEKAVSTRITRIDVGCLTTKKTKAELRGCGFVTCK